MAASKTEVPQPILTAMDRLPVPMVVLDLSTVCDGPVIVQTLATNKAYTDLFGDKPAGALTTPRKEALEALKTLVSGKLEGYQRITTVVAGDGHELQAEVWVRRLDDMGKPSLAAGILVPRGAENLPGDILAGLAAQVSEFAFIVTDHEWRIEHVSCDIESILGYTPPSLIGMPIAGLVHPEDLSGFLICASQTACPTTIARTRLRTKDGSWRPVVAFVSPLCSHAPPRLAILLAPVTEEQAPSDPSRAEVLEQRLLRIAMEVRAAGLLQDVGSALPPERAGQFAELSGRQWEIVTRLARGQSVAEIANAMYLSQSTVRNHLTAVYRKLGVHSQRELITMLRNVAPERE